MCTTVINDCLFPPILFCIYLAIALFFCYPKLKLKVNHADEINLNLLANREPKKCCCQKDKKTLNRRNKMIIYSQIIDDIEKFDRYRIYRICMMLGLDIKWKSQYKPIELLKTQIKQILCKYPHQVISAIRILLSQKCY